MVMDKGYLQHGEGSGPFITQEVSVKHMHADVYMAHYEGRWRKVHIQVKRTFIVYNGEKITIKVEGV